MRHLLHLLPHHAPANTFGNVGDVNIETIEMIAVAEIPTIFKHKNVFYVHKTITIPQFIALPLWRFPRGYSPASTLNMRDCRESLRNSRRHAWKSGIGACG